MRAAAVALACALIAGCTDPVTQGEVKEKVYEPARQWTSIVMIPTGCGKYGCTMIPVPMTYYDDEDWVINVWGEDGNREMKMRRFYLTRAEWEDIKLGEWFVSGDAYADDVHTRTRQ